MVASIAGHLRILKSTESLNQHLNPDLAMAELDDIMHAFMSDVQAGVHFANGWPGSNHGMTKLGVIKLAKILARDHSSIVVNSCCPGWCQTDMSSHSGPRTAEEGARTVFLLATMPSSSNCPSGEFYENEAISVW